MKELHQYHQPTLDLITLKHITIIIRTTQITVKNIVLNLIRHLNKIKNFTGGSPVHNNANKFVDQGYSNFAPSSTQQSSRGTRNVPIQIEGQNNPFNVTVTDSVSQSPIVIQK